jgi:hypothetical protein
MKPLALVPLVTYPDANSDSVAANAVAVAAQLGAELHALAVNVDIPDVSSALSKFLLNLPPLKIVNHSGPTFDGTRTDHESHGS